MAIKFSIIDYTLPKKVSLLELSPLLLGLVSGFSVFYFLYFFEAYGIQKGLSYSGHSHLYRAISFGVLTFAYLAIFETWIKPKSLTKQLKHAVIWYALLVILGSQLVFLLFNFFWNWQEWNLEAYTLIIKEFPLMIILPLAFYLLLKQIITFKNQKTAYLSFQSENGKDLLRVKMQDFLFANSSENYITISYLTSGQRIEHLIRKPLKILEEELKAYPEIRKNHRSYLVNKNNIKSIKQVKDKLYLVINDSNLPVSKRYQNEFLD